MMAIALERACFEEFIECYRNHPELWDYNREDYSHRSKKDKAYRELLSILRKINPQAGDLEVRSKVNSFRSSYRRERRKKMRIRQKNNGVLPKGEEPTLWFYNHFKFLDPFLDKPLRKTNKDSSWLDAEESQATSRQSTSPVSQENSIEEDPISSCNYNFVDVSSTPPADVKQFKQSYNKRHNSKPNIIEKEQTSFKDTRDDDPSEIYARAWALQFKQISGDQRVFAKKSIDDILFEASLGTLRRHSVKINDSLCQHCQTTFLNNEYEVQIESLIEER